MLVQGEICLGKSTGDRLPIRPSPTKPHVARFLLLDAKDLLAAGGIDLVAVLLPSMHSREGENRTETAALITAWESREKTLRKERSGEGRGSRRRVQPSVVKKEATIAAWGTII